MSALFFFALALQLASLVGVALWQLRYRRALSAFQAAAKSPAEARAAAEPLPEPARQIALRYLGSTSDPDDALCEALADCTAERPPRWAIALKLGLLLSAFAPACLGLIQTAAVIRGVALNPPSIERFSHVQELVEASFFALRGALHGSSWLLATLAIGGLLSWWLNRGELRQALLMRALLLAHTQLHPGAPAPKSVFVALRLRPTPSLSGAITATALWLAAVSAAAIVLASTAQLRAENFRPLSLNVWPAAEPRPLEAPPELHLPSPKGGGRPVGELSFPSLTITPAAASLQQTELTPLKDGVLPPGWSQLAPSLTEALKAYPRPLKLILLADASVPVPTVQALMRWLHREYKISEFFFVAQRRQALNDGASRLVQVQFPVVLKRAHEAPAITITSGELQAGQLRLDLQAEGWPDGLRRWADAQAGLRAGGVLQIFAGRRGARYGQLLRAMGAADTTCAADFDCGLPGRGLSFSLRRPKRRR